MHTIDLRRFDLNLLVVFDALMRERHVGRAAERLGLTQPAVSHALGRLRGALADPLFERHARGMRPTARAQALASDIVPLLQSLATRLRPDGMFDPLAAERSVTVGGSDYVDLLIAPRLTERFSKLAPRLDLRFRSISAETTVRDLRRREIDLAIGPIAAAPAAVRLRPLFTERLVLIARNEHPALRGTLDPQSYANLPHVLVSPSGDALGSVDSALRELGLSRRVAVTVPHFMAAPFIVGATDLVAVIAERVARRLAWAAGVSIHDLPVMVPGWSVGVATTSDLDGDPLLSWVVDQIAEVAAAI